MSDVFISYSRKDIAFARLIREALQQSDIDTWIDWERIPVGERWWEEICQAIENANVFMFIISQSSIGSKVCKNEIDQAIQNHKRIIPIVVDDLKPEDIREFAPELPQYNWIIFERDHIFRLEENPQAPGEKPEDRLVALPQRPQFEQALQKLSVAIHTDWEWVKYHTRLQVDALRWENNQHNPSYLIRGAALEEAEQQLFRAAGKEPQPSELQVSYVTASRQEETLRQTAQLQMEQKSRRRQQMVLWAVGIGLLVALVLGAVAWGQRNQYLNETHVRSTAEANAVSEANSRATAEANALAEADYRATAEANAVAEAQARATAQVRAEVASTQAVEQRNEAVKQAQIAFVRQLSAQARSLAGERLDLGLLLAVEANQRMDLSEARSSLLDAVQSQPSLVRYLKQGGWGLAGLAYSPDGQIMAFGTSDHTVLLLDAATGETRGLPLTGLEGEVLSLAFSHDGHYLAAGDNIGLVLRWDITNPDSPLQTGLYPVGYMKDNLRSIIASDLNPYMVGYFPPDIYLWNAPAAQVFSVCACGVSSLAFSPDGQFLATGMGSGEVTLWDLETGALERVFTIPKIQEYSLGPGMALDLAFTPDGQSLSVATSNGWVRTWKTADGEILASPQNGYPIASARLAISPDGNTLAYGLSDGSIHLLDGTSQQTGEVFNLGIGGKILSLAFSPDGSTLALGMADNTMILWDIQSHQSTGVPLGGHAGEVIQLAFSPDGRSLASLDWEHNLIQWDLQPEQRLLKAIDNGTETVGVVALSADGRYLVALGEMSGLSPHPVVWDLQANPPISYTLSGPAIDMYFHFVGVDFVADSHVIVLNGMESDYDGSSSLLWDLDTRQPGLTILASSAPMALSADGTRMAAFTEAGKAALWDTHTGALLQEMEDSQSGSLLGSDIQPGSALALSADGSLLATGQEGGALRVWHTADGEPAGPLLFEHHDQVTGLAFSPDGSLLASSSRDKSILVWDVNDLSASLAVLLGHKHWVSGVAFSPDGSLLVSSSLDGSLRLWDVRTYLGVGVLSSSLIDYTLSPVFQRDGSVLVSGGTKKLDTSVSGWPLGRYNQGMLMIWDYGKASWGGTACAIVGHNFSLSEWRSLFGQEPYRKTCPGLPLPPSVIEEFLVSERPILAGKGLQAALDDFIVSLPLDPSLVAELETSLATFSPENITLDTVQYVQAGALDPAVETYQALSAAGVAGQVSAGTWNTICWYGSLWDQGQKVLDICELAVSLDETNGGIRDSRGIARALTGDFAGAIDDFRYFITWLQGFDAYEPDGAVRNAWIESLEAGKNPFDAATLEALRSGTP